MRIRPEIRRMAEEMERRMRGREKEILAGDIQHWKQMPTHHMVEAAERHLQQLRGDALSPIELHPDESAQALIRQWGADACNYINFVVLRLTGAEKGG